MQSKKSLERKTSKDSDKTALKEFDLKMAKKNANEVISRLVLWDIISIVGAFAISGVIIFVLFNLKWQQNARLEAAKAATTAQKAETVAEDGEAVDNTDEITDTEVIDETGDLQSIQEEAEEEEEVTLYDENDVIYFIGGDFVKLQQRYANSEQIIGVESHYFVDEYLAVVYDLDTREVLSLESDGPGKMPIKLSGMKIGMSREEVYEKLASVNIEYTIMDSEDDGISFSAGVNDMRYKTEVMFEDDAVIDIICTVKYR